MRDRPLSVHAERLEYHRKVRSITRHIAVATDPVAVIDFDVATRVHLARTADAPCMCHAKGDYDA